MSQVNEDSGLYSGIPPGEIMEGFQEAKPLSGLRGLIFPVKAWSATPPYTPLNIFYIDGGGAKVYLSGYV
jgi:hypothetical protein